MPTDMISDNLTEDVQCPICACRDYDVIRPNSYPQGLTAEELSKVYRSASDHVLMDQMVACRQCSLVYLSPRIKGDIILEAYKSVVDEVFFKQNDFRIKTFKKSLQKFIAKFGVTPEASGPVLDIGCAGGAFLKAASELGFKGTGVEPSQWLCQKGKELYGLDLRPGILSDFNFPERSFGLVTMWDVIEHLTNPIEVLGDAHRLLADDGYFIINYPDYASLARRLMGKKWPFFLSVHLFYFTPKTITKLLDQCGFEVVEIKPFWQTLALGYVFKRASVYFGFFGWCEKLVRRLNLYDVPLTYNMGQTTVIAKKR